MNIIKELRKNSGITQDELGRMLGVQKAAICKYENGSVQLPQRHIDALCEIFDISADELLGRTSAQIASAYDEDESSSRPLTAYVPLVGRVHAGMPMLAVENIVEYIPQRADSVSAGEFFYMEVEGDCMIDDCIPEGAMVLVKKQNNANNNDIVVVRVEDEVLLRRIKFTNGAIVLIPSNAKYEPMIVTGGDVEIVGRVVEARTFF